MSEHWKQFLFWLGLWAFCPIAGIVSIGYGILFVRYLVGVCNVGQIIQ